MLEKLSKYMTGSNANNVGGLTPWQDVGALQKFGMGLGGVDVVRGYQKSVDEARKIDQLRKDKEAQQSNLARLAATRDPNAMMEGLSDTPEGLAAYSEFLNKQNKPKDRKILKDIGGRQRYVDDGSLVYGNVEAPEAVPLSPEGKLAADFKAGLIDEDLYKAKSQKPAKTTNFKDPQLKASSFGNRMIESAKLFTPIFNELDAAGESVVSQAAEAYDTILPDWMGSKMQANRARSPDQQQFRGAANEWIRAKLRKESGAVIADDEMDEEYRTYFPVVGDSPAAIKQKAKLRATATESMIKESAGAYEELYGKALKTQESSDDELMKALGL